MSFKDKIFGKFTKSIPQKKQTCAALILAAGTSSRMALSDNQSKQFLMLGDMPLLAYTLLSFERSPDISEIVVAARTEDFPYVSDIAKEFSISKLTNIVAGGETRADSSLHGVLELDGRCDFVAVHDGARPFVSQRVIHDAVEAAKRYGAAAPGVAPVDTVKEVGADGFVLHTHERSRLRLIQTPQAFDYILLRTALLNVKESGLRVTDDASAVEAIGRKVAVTDGDADNIKVTSLSDIETCERILAERGVIGRRI